LPLLLLIVETNNFPIINPLALSFRPRNFRINHQIPIATSPPHTHTHTTALEIKDGKVKIFPLVPFSTTKKIYKKENIKRKKSKVILYDDANKKK